MNTRIALPVGLALTVLGAGAEAQTLPAGMPVSDGTRVTQQRIVPGQRAFRINGTFVTVDANGNFTPAARPPDQITDPFALVARQRLLELQQLNNLNNTQAAANAFGLTNRTVINPDLAVGLRLQQQQAQEAQLAQLQRQANLQAAAARFRNQFTQGQVNPLIGNLFTPDVNMFINAALPAQTVDRALQQQQLLAQARLNQSQAQAAAALSQLSTGPTQVTNNFASNAVTNTAANGLNNGVNTLSAFNSGAANNGFANNGLVNTGLNNGFNNGFVNNGLVNTGFNNGFGNTGLVNNSFGTTGFATGVNGVNGGFAPGFAPAASFNAAAANAASAGVGQIGFGARTLRSFAPAQSGVTGNRVGVSSFRGGAVGTTAR